MGEISSAARCPAELYLDLLKRCLTRVLFPDRNLHYDLTTTSPLAVADRVQGRDWPTEAETMVGLLRLDSLRACIVNVLEDGIPGDLVETGVWRGGASIFMRAVLKAYGDCARRVWLADSFQGLPTPDTVLYPPDAGDRHHQLSGYLAVAIEEVKTNFQRYGLLDEQVCFLPGWFKDTLPTAPIERVAVLRLDGDMYESTLQALEHLYHKVSDGGYVVVDDYGALPNCRQAVEDFRTGHKITEPIFRIDWTGAFWHKGRFNPTPPPGTCGESTGEENETNAADTVFSEERYLMLHPDVAQALRQGHFASGEEHFLKYGKAEGRRSC
jgi:O-methyltransferase